MKGRGRELRIDGGDCLPPLLRQSLDPAPALRHVFVEGEQPARKANAEVMIEPALQHGTFPVVVHQVDALPDLTIGQAAARHIPAQMLKKK